jgi:hypothetical protein
MFILTLNTHSSKVRFSPLSFLSFLSFYFFYFFFFCQCPLAFHRAMGVDRHIDDLGNRLSPRTPQMWKVDICDLGVTTLTPDSVFGVTETRGVQVLGSY